MDHHHHHQHYQRHHNAFMDSRQLPVRPPPPVGFHADPNLYHGPPFPPVPPPHHHSAYHHQLPPPPPPPPPPQQHPSHFQPPPPPHYRPPSQVIHQPLHRPLAPQQPRPSFPYHHHNHSYHHEHNFDFPPSLRVLPANEGLVYDNTQYHDDDDHHRLGLPEPPRFSPTASMAPPISSSGFDRAVDFNHMSPPFREIHSDEFRHEIQSPQRFLDDLEGIRSDDWCDDRRIMDDVESDRLDDHFHDPYHPQMLPRGFDLNPGGSECLQRQMDDVVLMEDSRDGMIIDDDTKVRYDIQNSSREVSCSPIKFRNRGISRDDSFSEFYEEDMNRGSESVRYYERGRRQDMQDYNRSTRKNLRKKSAFLRIHPLKHSNFRNKHDTTPSPHKEPSEGLGDSLREGSDGSLVELDVSFKSNSLVAKAIVPAPSSSQIDPIDNSSLNDLDIRVDSKSPSKAESNRNCGYNFAVLTKVEKQSENRVRISPTLKRGGFPGKADVRISNTESASTGSVSGDSTHRGSPKGEISSKDSTNPGPRDISCPKVRKKRKSDIPLSRLSTSPLKTDTAGKKMKFIQFESVLSERSSQNSDLLGPLDSLISKAEFRSTFTECSMQPAEPIEQCDSVVLEKNIVASACNSFQTRFSDPESTNSDLSNGAQCSSASEKAPLGEKSSTYMSFKQEESPELVMGASSGGNHSALQSENRIKADNICGGTQCMEIGGVGNSSHIDILDEDNVAVNDNQASESKCLHLQVECNDGATSDNQIGIIGDPGHGSLVLVGDNIAVNDNLLLSGSNCLQMHGEFTNDGATADDHIGVSGHGPLGVDDIGSGDNIAVNDNITPGSIRLQVHAECPTGDGATAGDLFGDSCHGHGLLVVNIGSGDNIALNVNMPSDSNCQQMHAECTNDRASTADHITDSVYGPRVVDVDSGDNIAVNDNLPSGPDLPQLHADDGTATNFVLVGTHSSEGKSEGGSLAQDTAAAPHISLDEKLSVDAKHARIASGSLVAQGSLPDAFVESNEGKSEGDSLTQDTAPAPHISLDEKLSVDAKHASESLVAQGSLPDAFVESNEANPKPSVSAAVVNQPFAQKNVVLANNAKSTSSHVNLMNKQPIRKNVLIRGGGANCSSIRGPSVTAPPSKALSTYHVKPRIWRRTDNLLVSNTVVRKASHTAPLQRPPIDKITKAEGTSYIRKGNSLVRNPAARMGPGASSKSNAVTYLSKITRSPNMIESTVVHDRVSAAARNTHVQMPSTPPLPCSGMASDPEIGQSEGIENKAAKSCETAPSSSRNPKTELDRSVEDSGALSDGNFSTSDSKRTVSLKRKSNQLILPANPSKSSMHTMDKAPALSSDNGYYKRRKNQLIRASSEGNIQNMVSKTDDISNAQPQKACDMYSGRNFTKRQSNKGKPPKSSLVWKLGDAKSSGKGADPLRCGKILSHLLPWKRATYWRSVWRSSTQRCGSSSLMITRRLLSPRKRAAIYVRSGRGFSLRRSKVISLAGYSLKWSKSMEKRSKKVDEEVAQAVAKMGSAGNPKAGASGERIFRIGMFRYRMDPSRRTLQRIADEVSSNTATSKLEHGARKTYVPKRLLIGSNEYVRIGNGNQLVRDPKRRTRLLASEKVRWSLHTARMRLAKKRKFCQFFTRFGKCNKGEGKCPFIHDPSKIAVCTKFLNGLCGDVSCKLTHKVIPERMPDCSFFLQGSCSNVNCPYRHVNVNPKAPICENFLRGYCVDGNECLKKHSYICPEFEATGSCPQGSRCKLYHPKKGKGKKKKTLKDQRNSRGRYFGSEVGTSSEPEIDTTEKLVGMKNRGLEEAQQALGDFISLDVSDNEFGENDDATIEPMSFSQAQDVNSQLDHIHQLILPLRILG